MQFGEATVMLDRERTARVNFTTLGTMQQLGCVHVMGGQLERASLFEIGTFVFCALREDDPALTLETVLKNLTMENIAPILLGVSRAIAGAAAQFTPPAGGRIQ